MSILIFVFLFGEHWHQREDPFIFIFFGDRGHHLGDYPILVFFFVIFLTIAFYPKIMSEDVLILLQNSSDYQRIF